MFSVNASYDSELEITDEDNWAGAVRITTLSSDLKLSGAQLEGRVSPFLVALNTLADAQNKRTVDFVLKAEQDVAVANGEISLEILDEQQQSFLLSHNLVSLSSHHRNNFHPIRFYNKKNEHVLAA